MKKNSIIEILTAVDDTDPLTPQQIATLLAFGVNFPDIEDPTDGPDWRDESQHYCSYATTPCKHLGIREIEIRGECNVRSEDLGEWPDEDIEQMIASTRFFVESYLLDEDEDENENP